MTGEVSANRPSTLLDPASWPIEPSVLARHNVEGISSEVNRQGSVSGGGFGPWYFGRVMCKPPRVERPRYDWWATKEDSGVWQQLGLVGRSVVGRLARSNGVPADGSDCQSGGAGAAAAGTGAERASWCSEE
ncbi:MAG: hypothetical protein C5B60_10575 [Chloroflexi bacterium]|nr:MAG: hypothetical protein C5B60_10575 [Chloroflexota bacterium]